MTSNGSAVEWSSPWREGRGLRVRDVQYRAGAVQSRHCHQEPGFSLVLAGSLEETSSSGVCRAHSGSVVFKPAECWHANSYGPRGARVVQIAPAEGGWWPDVSCSYGWLESSQLARATLALLRQRPRAEERTELLFWETVEAALPNSGKHARPVSPRWWPQALELIETLPGSPISVAAIASSIGVHPVHLARVCRRQLGCTLRVHLLRRRTLLAWQACTRSAGSLAAIAAETGFADQAHMTRSFRRVLGVSPGELRKLAMGMG